MQVLEALVETGGVHNSKQCQDRGPTILNTLQIPYQGPSL